MRFLQTNGKFKGGSAMFNMAWMALLGLIIIENEMAFPDQATNHFTGSKTVIQKAGQILPTLNCLQGVNVSISQNGTSTLTPGYFVSPSYPNFASLQLSIVGRPQPIITCDDVGHYLTAVVYDPVDDLTCSSVFLVEDKLPPVFECTTIELPCGIDVYSLPAPYTPLVTVTDNCTNPPVVTILSHTERVYNCPSPYTFEIVRTYKATDASGNSSTCQDTVRFLRPVLNEIIFPNDTTISCEAFSSDTSVTGQPTWLGYPLTGVCYTWFNYTDKVIPMGCEGRYKIRRIWTVMDECNNTMVRDTQNIMAVDTTAPVLTCPDNEVIPTNIGSCVASYTFQDVQATDNCSQNITFSYRVDGVLVFTPGVSLAVGDHTIEVIANDGCNNTSSCSYIVTVEDQQGPSVTCHNINVGLGNGQTGTVCADSLDFDYFDNCGGPLTISVKKSTSSTYTNCITYTCNEVGSSNILQFRVCDQYGNCSVCEVTVTVQDHEAPVIDCGSSDVIELSCFDLDDFDPADYIPDVTDNCGTPVISWTVDNDLNCNKTGLITVTYVATDGSGNTASCNEVFNVTNTNPLDEGDIIWPADIADAGCTPDVTDGNVTGAPVLLGSFCNEIDIFSQLTDTTLNVDGCAVIHKTYTVIDSCLFNLSGGTQGRFIHTQLITVGGLTAPVLVIPADITVEPTDDDDCTAFVDLPLATATGCGGPITITNSFNNGGANADGDYPLGVTQVIFTATNSCGVQTVGTMTVTVEYSSDELLICPASYTISCMMDFNPANLPAPVIQNVCGSYELDTLITGDVDNMCGTSLLTVTYSIETHDGRTDVCSFNISVEGSSELSEANIDWPENNITVSCESSHDPYVINSFPTFTSSACYFTSVSFSDEAAVATDPAACYAISRSWTVIDSCNYNPVTNDGLFTYTQLINIVDTIGPQLIGINNNDTVFAVVRTEVDCKNGLDLSNNLIEIGDCSPIVDFNSGLPLTFENGHLDLTGVYEVGTIAVGFSAEDTCGNVSNFNLYLTIIDSLPPGFACPDSINVYINPSGLDTIYASEFAQFGYPNDNCNSSPVIMTFDSLDLGDSVLYLACTGNPADLSIEDVSVWVFDLAGLSTSCKIDLNILVPEGETIDCSHMMGIVGQLANENGIPIENAEVHAHGAVDFMEKTGATGQYQIRDIPPGSDIELEVAKNESAIKGVNISDVIAIRDHILGKKPFNSPYKILASDVNNDNSISVRDLLEMRKLILGYTDQYTSEMTWRFADKSYKFPNKNNPFNQPALWKKQLQNVVGMLPVVNFVGLKLGDVNNSSLADGNDLEIRSSDPMMLLASVEGENESEIRIKLTGADMQSIRGFQFDLAYDLADLQLVNVETGDLSGFTTDNYRIDEPNGRISFNWDDEAGREGERIVTLTFRKLGHHGQAARSLSLADDRIEALAGDASGNERTIQLITTGKWTGNRIAEGKLLQNSPNPFTNKTTINVLLTQPAKGKLTVYDVSGKPVYTRSGDFAKGMNTIEIKAEDLLGSGVYIYKFESDVFTDTRKMILTL